MYVKISISLNIYRFSFKSIIMKGKRNLKYPNMMSSSFGILLTVKMLLAFSVLGHFFTAMYLSRTKKMTCNRFKFIHLSVFCHQIIIVFLAKNMFYISW